MWGRWRGCASGWQPLRMVGAVRCAVLCWRILLLPLKHHLALPPPVASQPRPPKLTACPSPHRPALPAPPAGQKSSLQLAQVVITHLPSADSVTFPCFKLLLRSTDSGDTELVPAE
jgi:hypothetical protein